MQTAASMTKCDEPIVFRPVWAVLPFSLSRTTLTRSFPPSPLSLPVSMHRLLSLLGDPIATVDLVDSATGPSSASSTGSGQLAKQTVVGGWVNE